VAQKKNNLESLKLELVDLEEKKSSLESQKREDDSRKFDDVGGCSRCDGRGWVVTWDTLDSMSGCYAEYGDCPEDSCNPQARSLSGFKPRFSKYDRQRGTEWRPIYSVDEKTSLNNLTTRICEVHSEIRSQEIMWAPEKGKLARVVKEGRGPKARRTPVGVEGLIVRLFTNEWGTTKTILLDTDGKKHWPNVKYIEVIDPDPDTSVWEEMDRKERHENGYPVVVTLKKKTGRAALIRTTTGVEMWMPFSQASELREAKERDTISVMMPMWLAEKKGFVTKDSSR